MKHALVLRPMLPSVAAQDGRSLRIAKVALMVSSDPGLDPGERPSNHERGAHERLKMDD